MLEKPKGMCPPETAGLQNAREYATLCSLRHTRSVTYRSRSAGSSEVSHIVKRRCRAATNGTVVLLYSGILNRMSGLIDLRWLVFSTFFIFNISSLNTVNTK